MKTKNETSMKVNELGKSFVEKFKANRRGAGVDDKEISFQKALDTIATYFKLNNDRYLELIELEAQNV